MDGQNYAPRRISQTEYQRSLEEKERANQRAETSERAEQQAYMAKVFIDRAIAGLEHLNNEKIPAVADKIEQARFLAKQTKQQIDSIVDQTAEERPEAINEGLAEEEIQEPVQEKVEAEAEAAGKQKLKNKWIGKELVLDEEDAKDNRWTVVRVDAESGRAILTKFDPDRPGHKLTRNIALSELEQLISTFEKEPFDKRGLIDFSHIENSFEGLRDLFRALEDNLNTQGDKEGRSYDSKLIKRIILEAVEGKAPLESVPVWGGLREKVAEIKAAIDQVKEKERNKAAPTAEKIRELREKLNAFKQKRERYLKAKLAYEKIGLLINKKKKEAILKEYYAAREEYEQARAEYVVGKANRFINERLRAAETEADLVLAEKKSNKFKEKYHQLMDGFYNGYKKLGEFNLTDKLLGKMLVKKEKDGKVKRCLKTVVGTAGRLISVRTAVSLGLLGGGVLLAGSGAGALAVVPLYLRRALGGTGSAIGAYDFQKIYSKQERQIRKLKSQMADESYPQNLSQAELEEYLSYFEARAVMDGKSATQDKLYRQLRLEYMKRLKGEQAEKVEDQALKFIQAKLKEADKELGELKRKFKFQEKRRKAVALTAGVLVGSGAIYSVARHWLLGGSSGGDIAGEAAVYDSGGRGGHQLADSLVGERASAAADSGLSADSLAGQGKADSLKIKSALKLESAKNGQVLEPRAAVRVDRVDLFDYQGGKTVWQEVDNQLINYFKQNNLSEMLGQDKAPVRTYLVDYLKDKLAASPESYGLAKGTDINNLTQAELAKLDWHKLVGDNLERAMDSAEKLAPAAKETILTNNQIISKLAENKLIKDWGEVDKIVNEVKNNFDGDVEFYKDYQRGVEYINQHIKELAAQVGVKNTGNVFEVDLDKSATGNINQLVFKSAEQADSLKQGMSLDYEQTIETDSLAQHESQASVQEPLTYQTEAASVNQEAEAPSVGNVENQLEADLKQEDIIRQETFQSDEDRATIVQENDRVSSIREHSQELVNDANYKVTEKTVQVTSEWGLETGLKIRQASNELVKTLFNQDKFIKTMEKFAGHKLTGEERTYWLEQRQNLLDKYQSYGGKQNPAAFGRVKRRLTHLLQGYVAEKKLSPEQLNELSGGVPKNEIVSEQPQPEQPAEAQPRGVSSGSLEQDHIIRQETVQTEGGSRTIVQEGDRVSDIQETQHEYTNQTGHKVTEKTVKTTAEWGTETGLKINKTAHELVKFLPNQNKFLKLIEKFAGHKLTGEERTYWLEQRQNLLDKYQSYGGKQNPAAFGRVKRRLTHLLQGYVAEKKLSPEQLNELSGGGPKNEIVSEQPQPEQPAEAQPRGVSSGSLEQDTGQGNGKIKGLMQEAIKEIDKKETKSLILRKLENYIGKKYSIGRDGYDCMTLIKEVGKKVKNDFLKQYEHFINTHSGEKLTFAEFLKDKPVDFRGATWEVVKEKIKPGIYLVSFESPGGSTYVPEGHGGILEVALASDGRKTFKLVHASTAALKAAEYKQPVPLHELKIEVDGQTYSGRKIITSFADKFKKFLARSRDGARIYRPELVEKMKFYDKLGNQLHPKLEADGSLRLGYVIKETDLDSYFKYNQNFSKNITALKLEDLPEEVMLAAE